MLSLKCTPLGHWKQWWIKNALPYSYLTARWMMIRYSTVFRLLWSHYLMKFYTVHTSLEWALTIAWSYQLSRYHCSAREKCESCLFWQTEKNLSMLLCNLLCVVSWGTNIPQQGYGLEGGTYFSVRGGRGGDKIYLPGGGVRKVGQGGGGGGQKFFVQNRRFLEKIAFFPIFSQKLPFFLEKLLIFSQDHGVFLARGGTDGGRSKFWPGGDS